MCIRGVSVYAFSDCDQSAAQVSDQKSFPPRGIRLAWRDSLSMADTAFLPQSKLAYLIEAERPSSDFKSDVIDGLSSRPFELHPKYFYDARGAELFEAICTTPEYYVTSAEKALLEGKRAGVLNIKKTHYMLFT